MKNFFKKIKKSRGFALLFAVLAASLLLSIGLSIFTITVKEITLSSYSTNSQFSFYAADSGAECGLYWDIKGNSGITFATSTDSTSNGLNKTSINCGNTVISLTVSAVDAYDATTTFSMPLNDVPGQDYCALVTVAKSNPGGTQGVSSTYINSLGYNICNSSAVPTWGNQNLVERALKVSY